MFRTDDSHTITGRLLPACDHDDGCPFDNVPTGDDVRRFLRLRFSEHLSDFAEAVRAAVALRPLGA